MKGNDVSRKNAGTQPLEDRALKGAARLFGEELMPLLGIEGKVLRIAPTEEVELKPQDFLQDFNYEMTDGSWLHLEFESDSIKTEDLRRFRNYEAITSYHHGVDVTTCVICSSQVKHLKDVLETGINTYRVKILRMKNRDADSLIYGLEHRQKNGRLSRTDLLEILLTPLMSGQLSQQERITRGFRLLKEERKYWKKDEMMQMEAVLYVFAMKFLKTEQLKEIKEMMSMTVLGEMIMQDGIEIGEARGIKIGETRGIKIGETRGIKIGETRGIRIGEDAVNRLNAVLIRQNRFNDLERATEDKAYQKKLMRELFPDEEDKE